MEWNLLRAPQYIFLLLAAVLIAVLFMHKDPFALCLEKPEGERGGCVVEAAVAVAENVGIQAALDAVRIFPEDPKFSAYCHPAVHAIGAAAYRRVSAGEEVPISEDMRRCANGFFHGFLVEMISQGGSLTYAASLCGRGGGTTLSEGNFPEEDCYHGIGNGIVENTTHPKSQPVGLLQEARDMCRSISATSTVFRSCIGGVYNRVGNWYARGDISDTTISPVSLCETVHDETQSLCLEFLQAGALARSTLSEAVSNFPAGMSDTSKEQIVMKIASLSAKTGTENNLSIMGSCHQLSVPLSEACIAGYVLGLVDLGAANQIKSEEAITFCSARELTIAEREVCMRQAVSALSSYWGSDKLAVLCMAAPETVRLLCAASLPVAKDNR